MKISCRGIMHTRSVPAFAGDLSLWMPDRIRNKILGYERTIGNFRQRRWS